MVNLLGRLITLTLIPCIVGLAAALLVMRGDKLPEVEAGLALCDVPCWAGLEPGRTAVADVPEVIRAQLHDSPVTLEPYQRFTAYMVHVPGRSFGAISASEEGMVSTIRLDVAQPLWPILLLLDEPRCVEWMGDRADLKVMNIYWEQDGVYVMSGLALSRQNPHLLTSTLYVWQPASSSTPPCERYGRVSPWPGFAALRLSG